LRQDKGPTRTGEKKGGGTKVGKGEGKGSGKNEEGGRNGGSKKSVNTQKGSGLSPLWGKPIETSREKDPMGREEVILGRNSLSSRLSFGVGKDKQKKVLIKSLGKQPKKRKKGRGVRCIFRSNGKKGGPGKVT